MDKFNMRLSLWLWVLLCGACMAVMLWYASQKTVVIADGSPEQAGLSGEAGYGEQWTELTFQKEPGISGSFCVPLPHGVKPENVVVENRYLERELWIYVQSVETEFYETNAIFGDVGCIRGGHSEEWGSEILLKLEMADVLEYHNTLEGNSLTIAYGEPYEIYDHLVVIDPVGGGSENGADGYGICEKELALEVARQVQRDFALPGVRLYVTRSEDVEVSMEQRLQLAEAVHADLYIRIGAAEDPEDPGTYGIRGIYNKDYFIPGFGNADLADIVTRAVTVASSNRADGLVPAEEGSILKELKIPAMELSMGYLSNPQEEDLLERETYRARLAEGIINAIGEACERLERPEEE